MQLGFERLDAEADERTMAALRREEARLLGLLRAREAGEVGGSGDGGAVEEADPSERAGGGDGDAEEEEEEKPERRGLKQAAPGREERKTERAHAPAPTTPAFRREKKRRARSPQNILSQHGGVTKKDR